MQVGPGVVKKRDLCKGLYIVTLFFYEDTYSAGFQFCCSTTVQVLYRA